jgi:Lon protease-like protein
MPVFPLPNVVLFPHTNLELHIFEPRYLEMVADLLSGDRWLAVALIDDEGHDDAPPAFHPVAGAGRIGRYSKLTDGRYNIVVEGLERVVLSEIRSDRAYRMVEATSLPEDLTWLSGREGAETLNRIVFAAARLGLLGTPLPRSLVPQDAERRAALVNRLACAVTAESSERQALLAASGYRERSDLLVRQLRFASALSEALARHPRPEDPGRN